MTTTDRMPATGTDARDGTCNQPPPENDKDLRGQAFDGANQTTHSSNSTLPTALAQRVQMLFLAHDAGLVALVLLLAWSALS